MNTVILELSSVVETLSKNSGKSVDEILKEIREEIKMKKFREILLK